MISLKTFTSRFGRLIFFVLGGEGKSVDYVNGADQLPPPLSKDDEQKAFELLATDEKKARELLYRHDRTYKSGKDILPR